VFLYWRRPQKLTPTLSNDKIAILAGEGRLPHILADTIAQSGQNPFVINLNNTEKNWMLNFHTTNVKVTQISKLITILRTQNISTLVMAGGIYTRPKVSDFLYDWRMYGELWRLFKSLKNGDDGLLRAAINLLERKNFIVKGVLDFAPFLRVRTEILTKRQTDEEELRDIKIGIDAAKQLGAADIGQAVVVRNGTIIAQEDKKGTQYMLESLASAAPTTPSGFLIKWSKPNQELRVDLPTIGTDTITQIISAGLRGIIMEADNSLILDRDLVRHAANDAELCIAGMKV
jgi:UDP-2,3-diacylglucosamine hydrolase